MTANKNKPTQTESLKVAYLASRYPATSHTFIRREVCALRRMGINIITFSVRRTPIEELQSTDDLKEWKSTIPILPTSIGFLLSAHFRAFVKSPRSYCTTFLRSFQDRRPGARAAIWSIFYFVEAVLFSRQLETHGVSHVHSHFANVANDVGYLAATLLGIDWSQTLHGPADFEEPRKLLRQRISAARFTACISYFARAQAMYSSDPEDWSRFAVIHCGVDLSRIPRRLDGKKQSKRQTILAVGRLDPMKGYPGLFEAFETILKNGVNAELRIIGDGSEKARLQSAIRDRKLDGHVKFLGAQPEDRVLHEMARADVFVLSSFTEGLPVVLMEAMAVGVPVVAPRITGIPELVEDRVTGYLFTPSNWSELTGILERMLKDPDYRTATARNAWNRIESDFNINDSAEALKELFCKSNLASSPVSRQSSAGFSAAEE